jgi:WD40 repeat protein
MRPIQSRRQFLAAVSTVIGSSGALAGSVSPPITALTFSPDGSQIITGSQSGLTLLDDSAALVKSLIVEMDNVHDVQFSPDGNLLVVVGGNPAETGVMELYHWPSLNREHRHELHEDVIHSVSFSTDGTHLVIASADEVCSVYDLESTKIVSRFTQHSRGVASAIFLPDDETIISGAGDETLRVWTSSTAEDLRTLHNHSRQVSALALRRNSSGLPLVASASADLTVRLWQPTIGRMMRFAKLLSEPLCLAWCGGGHLIAGCRDGQARLINADSVQIERTIDVASGWLYRVAVDPADDRQVVFGSDDGRVYRVVMTNFAGLR